ncbi:ABC transporter ATP-binding protein [Oceanobacillus sojae]|uniref:ABC transporter ATP-binding protein n=1 Tax=Oceanobacillus sojae TaxID=582851 RepID=UPI0021A2F9C9|nr:ABC transporter ATP-binding protein [Oceanobacillus sojae]MCT1904349.1 ABC transporter ATP-binding protein/permease [Oceanobacillus sojae]
MNISKKLLTLFNKTERKKLFILLLMMIFAALLETIGIGLIVPLVGIVTSPDIIHKQTVLSNIYEFFNFQSDKEFIVLSVVTLLSVFVLKNVYLFIFNYAQVRVILNQQIKLSRTLFKEYLTKPYTFHLQKNTANLLRNINEEVPKVVGIIVSAFQLFTEILVIICITIILLIVSPIATIVAAVLLSGSVLLFFKLFRKKIDKLGEEQQRLSGEMIKWVNQGLGASKEVKVSGKENYFIQAYTLKTHSSVKINRYMSMLEIVPRLFIETLLVSIVLITLLIIISQGKESVQLVSTMALFAMAAFRLMPSINRVVSLISGIRYSLSGLNVIYQDLVEKEEYLELNRDLTIINKKERVFQKSIQLTDVSFRYPNQKEYSIKDISLTIPIGESVAFIGESGAGKTTLVDIILGLFEPEKGQVFVDEKNLYEQMSLWQQKIGYIPQSIYLSDDTIRNNVAFGLNNHEIDDNEVWRALEQAQLKDFVELLPNKLETKVGERGVRLSGGQRQRIGIARALYYNPEILFMDEATSSLDNETEKQIMKAFDNLKGNKTLIIIAHRLSTIENCDIIFRMNKGRLVTSTKTLAKTVMN